MDKAHSDIQKTLSSLDELKDLVDQSCRQFVDQLIFQVSTIGRAIDQSS